MAMKQPLFSWHLPTPRSARPDWIATSTLADRSSPAPSRPTPHPALRTGNRDSAHDTKPDGRAMPSHVTIIHITHRQATCDMYHPRWPHG